MSKLIDLDALMNTVSEEETKRKEQENTTIVDENFLSFKSGNTYLVRFLPNMSDHPNTFTNYEEYGFTSATGQGYVYAGRTAHSVKRKDIIKDLQWKTFSEGRDANDEAMKKRSYSLFPQKKQMVNVYVIDDPVNPDNNGTVKILRYSSKTNKQGEPTSPLYAKILEGIWGENKDDIGKKAFDLSKDGVTFAIKVTENAGGWNDYSSSGFKFPSDIGLTDDDITSIYDQTHNLVDFIPDVLSDEDIKALLDVHWYGTATSTETPEVDLSNEKDEQSELASVSKSSDELDEDMGDYLDGLDLDD